MPAGVASPEDNAATAGGVTVAVEGLSVRVTPPSRLRGSSTWRPKRASRPGLLGKP